MTHRRLFAWTLLLPIAGCFAEPEKIAEPGTGSEGQTDTIASTGESEGGTSGTNTATSTSTSPTGEDTASTTGSDPTTTASDPTTDPTASDDATSDDSTGEPATCGDGIVNAPDEMCDGTPGCTEDCEFENYACNPLTNAGCIEGLRCGVADYDAETVACMPIGSAGLGEACSGVPNNDGDCGDGLTCVFNSATNYCNFGSCCVEFCDLTTGRPTCTNGATCKPFWPTTMYKGLEHLGLCRT